MSETIQMLLGLLLAILFSANATAADSAQGAAYVGLKQRLVERFGSVIPKQWGENVSGVKNRIRTRDKVIALTFDACGSAKGMGYDSRLIEFLEREQVPATLFINARWIGPNRAAFDRLANNPRFDIANHGFRHKPASVNGKSVYGIAGTRSVAELVDE